MLKFFRNRKKTQRKKAKPDKGPFRSFQSHVRRTSNALNSFNHAIMTSSGPNATALPLPPDPVSEPVQYLRSLYAIRNQAKRVIAKAEADQLQHFDVHMDKLPDVTKYVTSIIKRDYAPNFSSIPPHGRWQHLDAGGVPRLDQLLQSWEPCSAETKTRRMIDLFLVSVLLDAGAGPDWTYVAEAGKTYARSEGLAVASLDMFKSGMFSSSDTDYYRVDGKKLKSLTPEMIGKGFQVSEINPMEGLKGRANLLVSLGSALDENKVFFGHDARPGNILDYLLSHPTTRGVEYPVIALPTFWNLLMDGLAPIWPASRTKLNGVSLGDAWPLSTLTDFDLQHLTWESVMPFHKLTQWLCYSLMHPMTRLLNVTFDGDHLLTGLAEYRNGGLLVDLGLITLKSIDAKRGLESFAANAQIEGQPNYEVVPCFEPADEVVVEWRAVTVGMLDILLWEVNKDLGLDGKNSKKKPLTLAQMLEAGTWKAGREIAQIQRPNTKGPPIMILSDGTVF